MLWLAGPLFLVSGAAALVLESIWIRLFALSFGTTGLAMATVLTAFMAGLALGGALGGRVADRLDRPHKLFLAYAAMETVIALCAISMPLFRRLATAVDVSLESGLGGSLLGLSLGRFAVASLVLLIPTTLMGATLPVLSRAVVGPRGTRLARYGGALYSINTWGAVAGAAATPFLLLPAFGVWGTGLAVGLADFLVAACAAGAAVRWRRRSSDPSAGAGAGTGSGAGAGKGKGTGTGTEGGDVHTPGTAWLGVVGIGLSGAVAMVYQQVWARVLSLIVGSSIYAVSLILALFLLGLAAGSAIYSRRTALREGQAANLGVMHAVVALWAVATIWLADKLPALFVIGLKLTEVEVSTVLLLQVAIVALVVVLPTFFMGMTFPATLALVERGLPGLGPGRAVGRVYSGNTLGAIAGSFLGGFVILPGLGAQSSLMVCVVASLVLALGYTALAVKMSGLRRAVAAAVVLVTAILMMPYDPEPWNLAALSSGVFRVSRSSEVAEALDHLTVDRAEGTAPAVEPELRPWTDLAQRLVRPEDIWNAGFGPEDPPEMIFHEAGITATVAVTETRARSILAGHDWVTYSLRVNGKADASLTVLSGLDPGDPAAISPGGDAETQTLSGMLAFLLHPGRPRTALVIGWGSGLTAGAALDTGLERVRAVEIEAEVIRGSAPFQPYAGHPLRDPRLDLVEDDGRRLLASRDERYDLIVSEPSNPWITGCSNLFTVEFFRLVDSRLGRGGRFLQWVQAYEISPQTMASILASVRAVFDSVVVFQPGHSPSDLLIVAGQDPVDIDPARMVERLAEPAVAARLRPFGVRGPEDVAARLVLDAEQVDRAVRGVERNTDNNLLVELAAPFELVRFRDAGGRRLIAALGGGPTAIGPERLAAVPDLAEGLARAGRPSAPPEELTDERLRGALVAAAPPEASAAVEALDEEGGLARLARALEGQDRATGLGVLGLAAALRERERLAMILLLAHLRSASRPIPEVRELLARWSLEAGQPARAWELRACPERNVSHRGLLWRFVARRQVPGIAALFRGSGNAASGRHRGPNATFISGQALRFGN